MKVIKVEGGKIEEKDLQLVVKYLQSEKVVVLPTDTVYGLSCLATSASGIKKIHKIKGSDNKKPLIVLVDSFEMLANYAEVGEQQKEYLNNLWLNQDKIPTTVILKAKDEKLKFVLGSANSIAVRLQKNEINYRIIKDLGKPIVSTSLNRTGGKTLEDLNQLEDEFAISPDLALDVGKIEKKTPSRLIDIRDINNIKILRN
jgi:L-threonylcarbamoyladenylate synthase